MGAEFTIRLAGTAIGVSCLYPETEAFFAEYRAEGPAAFSVGIGGEDVEHERLKSYREDELEGIARREFSSPYLETLAVCRKISEQLPRYNALLLHGSAIAVDGQAYLFTAKSGTGKSTHTRLWRQLLGSRAVMVNDDKPFLKVSDCGVLACGSPWDGKHHLSRNIMVPLKAICFLQRGQENTIRPLETNAAYPRLIQSCYRPADTGALLQVLTLAERLGETVRFYELHCNMEPGAAELSFGQMSEE